MGTLEHELFFPLLCLIDLFQGSFMLALSLLFCGVLCTTMPIIVVVPDPDPDPDADAAAAAAAGGGAGAGAGAGDGDGDGDGVVV